MARELNKRGHQASVIASSFDHMVRTETHMPRRERMHTEVIDGVRWVWLKTPEYKKSGFARVVNMLAFSRRLKNERALLPVLGQPDVVVGSTPHPFGALASWKLAVRNRAAFVLEVRDLWPETLVQLAGLSRGNPFVRVLSRIERKLIRNADQIVTLLPDATPYLVSRGGEPTRISWIPNGVDLSTMPDPYRGTESDTTTIMYAGAHGPSNALDQLLDAAARIDPSHRISVRLIGDGPEKKRLEQRVRSEAIRCVSFEDPVPKNQVHTLLAEADCFVAILMESPLYQWGMSLNKIFDYMAMGRPTIIATGASNNPIAEAEAGVSVKTNAPDDLAEAMISVAKMDRGQRREMGTRGRAYVESHHDIAQLTSLMDAVLARAKSSKSQP